MRKAVQLHNFWVNPVDLDSKNDKNIGDNEILVKAVDYGESRITIDNPTFVTPSLEERERASAEYLLVQKIIAQQTEQLTFDLEFISPVDTLITSPYGKKRFINESKALVDLASVKRVVSVPCNDNSEKK